MKFKPYCTQCGRLVTNTDPYIGKGFCDPWCWMEHLQGMDYGSQDELEPYEDKEGMIVIIAGGRTITDACKLEGAVRTFTKKWEITQVVSGGARGADALGEDWARKNRIQYVVFRADWKQHGKGAGPIRNERMAKYADALIALWDGKSRGTADMIRRARSQGLIVHVRYVE